MNLGSYLVEERGTFGAWRDLTVVSLILYIASDLLPLKASVQF